MSLGWLNYALLWLLCDLTGVEVFLKEFIILYDWNRACWSKRLQFSFWFLFLLLQRAFTDYISLLNGFSLCLKALRLPLFMFMAQQSSHVTNSEELLTVLPALEISREQLQEAADKLFLTLSPIFQGQHHHLGEYILIYPHINATPTHHYHICSHSKEAVKLT